MPPDLTQKQERKSNSNSLNAEKTTPKELWKLNPVIEQFYSQQLSIEHAKSLTKETENGAEH